MHSWLDEPLPVTPRPLLLIEDERKFASEFIDMLAKQENVAGDILGACTLLLLDTPGPDTQRNILDLMGRYPALQIVAGPFDTETCRSLSESLPDRAVSCRGVTCSCATDSEHGSRLGNVTFKALDFHEGFVELVDRLIRPGGMVLCDVELKPLSFQIPGQPNAESWQRMRGPHAAAVACSKQKHAAIGGVIYEATELCVLSKLSFGASGAGREFSEIDPDLHLANAFAKREQDLGLAIAAIREKLSSRFPWTLRVRSPNGCLRMHRVGPADLDYCHDVFDVLHWPDAARRMCQSGVLTTGTRKRPWRLAQGPAGKFMSDLVKAHLSVEPRAVTVRTIESYLSANSCSTPYHMSEGARGHLRDGHEKEIIPEPKDLGDYFIAAGYWIGRIDPRVLTSFDETKHPT